MVGFEFGLASADAGVGIEGGVGVAGAEVEGFAEPVGGIHGKPVPVGHQEGNAGGVVVTAGAVQHEAFFGVRLVRAPLVDGGGDEGDAGNRVGAVQVPHGEQFVAAAAHVARLKVPAARQRPLPAEVVVVLIRRAQVGIEQVEVDAGVRNGALLGEGVQGIDKLGGGDDDLVVPRRGEADLLKGDGVDLAVLHTGAAAQHAPRAGEAAGETGKGREVVAVARVRDGVEAVHLDGARDGLVAQAVVEGEVGPRLPVVAHVELHVPVAEAAGDVADGEDGLGGGAQAQIGDGVAAEVVVEGEEAAVAVRFDAVQLAAEQVETGGPVVKSGGLAQLGGGAEEVLVAADGNSGERAEGFEAGDGDHGADVAGSGQQQRGDAVEAGGDVEHGGGAHLARPRRAHGVGTGVGVGILTGDKLEGLDVLRGEEIAQGESVAVAELVEARPGVVVVDDLGCVGVERARIHVGAVGQIRGVGVQEALDDGAGGGVVGEGGALVGLGHEHVAVDGAAEFLLGALEGYVRSAPGGKAEVEAVVVLVGGLHVSHLEERTRADDAVLVGLEDAAVQGGGTDGGQVEHRRGGVAELGAEVAALGAELLDDGRGGAQANA